MRTSTQTPRQTWGSALTESDVLRNDQPVMMYGLAAARGKGFDYSRKLGSILTRAVAGQRCA